MFTGVVVGFCVGPGMKKKQNKISTHASAPHVGNARLSYPSRFTRKSSRNGSQPWKSESPRRNNERFPSNI